MSLRDAHIHLAELGRAMTRPQLSDCETREDCIQRINDAARNAPPDAWIIAEGLRPAAWNDPAPPTADQLQAAADNRPVVINGFDCHSMFVSRTALERARINADTPDPDGGRIIRNDDNQPTGALLESACNLVRKTIPEETDDDIRANLRTAQSELTRCNVTEAHDMHATAAMTKQLIALDRNNELTLRTRLFATPDCFEDVRDLVRNADSDRIRLGGVKLFTDGTLNSRTAFMLNPFQNPLPDAPNGTPFLTDHEILGAFTLARIENVAVAAHAIGDAAVRRMLDLYERFNDASLTLRIEHAQFIAESDIQRFPIMGVIASMQPCHLLTDIEAVRTLTPDSEPRAFPLRGLIDACLARGITPSDNILLGSDAPIVPPNPKDNIIAAKHRRRKDMPTHKALAPDQAIDEATIKTLMTATA